MRAAGVRTTLEAMASVAVHSGSVLDELTRPLLQAEALVAADRCLECSGLTDDEWQSLVEKCA
jgi:hypothetical protein